MKGRKILTAPTISAVSVKIIRIGSSMMPSAISVSLTIPSLRSRMVQAKAFTMTLAASGRNSVASNSERKAPRACASANAAG